MEKQNIQNKNQKHSKTFKMEKQNIQNKNQKHPT